ncbi:WXG100 family type VII secretion target [Anaerosporobacter faecicola]|uniref:WXG100 family type VII secretion target n=1 Tax=Anaerosporobacter faecicola TaxID=2718714 RepID=UPI00143C8D64|nr:WXG100 family type VII secretion target [Anaerosporobacter faecicola]
MEGIIKVTPEQLSSTADTFSTKGKNVSSLTTEMTNLAVGLSAIWTGDAAEAYRTKFKDLDADIQKINKMIQEHAADLKEMASVYTKAEKDSQDEISSLASNIIN